MGLLTGALVSAWAVRLLEAQLYDVRPYDLRLAVAGLLAAVALAGTLVPSLRASRANPVTALRTE